MHFMLVSEKTIARVTAYFGVHDPVAEFWFFGSRLVAEGEYFIEEYTTEKRLKERYFDKLEESHREALFNALWPTWDLLHNDGMISELKLREELGFSPRKPAAPTLDSTLSQIQAYSHYQGAVHAGRSQRAKHHSLPSGGAHREQRRGDADQGS